jgi:hypothetical protein
VRLQPTEQGTATGLFRRVFTSAPNRESSMKNDTVQQVVRPSQDPGRVADRKPEDENAVPSWGQSATLGTEVTPSDVLKQQEKK